MGELLRLKAVFDALTFNGLKKLNGEHRIQRVSPTEKNGRRHSSTVIVICLEDKTLNETKLNQRDIRVDVFRSSGAGGQHRNKVSTGIRLTHWPTGVVVTATEERSQHQNRQVAWKRLEEKVTEIQLNENNHLNNNLKSSHFNNGRSWSWTSWRNEVKSPDGVKSSMSKALSGDLNKILS